jgi:hypothetical protein
MDSYDIINFILFTIIIALIIHIILKNVVSHKNDNIVPLRFFETPNNTPNINNNTIPATNDIIINNTISANNDNDTYTTKIKEVSQNETTALNNDNKFICSDDKYTDDFFNEYVFYGRNKVDKTISSNKEKINYRDNYFNFRDNINTMPNQNNDAVDMINDMVLAENEGNNINNNKPIKDIYDSLTKKDFFFEEINKNIQSFHETIGTGGQQNTLNVYTYKNDTVSNGCEYFNGVYPNSDNANEELLSL